MDLPVIAITGATGFVGRRLVRALVDAGYNVRALARRRPPPDGHDLPAVTWITGSLEDEPALDVLLQDAFAVVHCAGAIKARDRDGFFAANVAGTRRLAAHAAAKANPPRLIHISSLAAREPRLSSYAASKRAAEQALVPFQDALRTVILRPPGVYGPGDLETLRIFRLAAHGWFFAPWGESRISLVHVDDAAGAVLAVLKADAGAFSQPVEFDDGHPGGHRWEDIAAAAGRALATRPRILRLPAVVFYGLGAVGSLTVRLTGRPSVVTWGKMRELLHPDWAARGPQIPGYAPVWPLTQGFENTVEYYASRGMLKSNG